MNVVLLHELGMQRDAVEQERDERDVELRRELRVHGRERARVRRPVVRRNLHAGEQHARAVRLAELDHLREIRAQRRDRLAAQAVVAAELDHDERRRMRLEQPRQARETAGRGVARDAGIHDFISVRFGLEATAQHRDPRLLGGQPVTAAQRVANHDDRLFLSGRPARRHVQDGECGEHCKHELRRAARRLSMSTGDVLRAEGLTKKVSSPEGELTILDDVTFSVARGATAAIVGPSGAGKSTLLALLAGLDEPTSGRVWLNGAELTALDEDGRAGHAQSRSRLRIPIVSPVAVVDRGRERAAAARAQRARRTRPRARAKRSWTWGSSTACGTIRSSCRAARSSASRSRARSSRVRRCCSPTSLRATWTTRRARES